MFVIDSANKSTVSDDRKERGETPAKNLPCHSPYSSQTLSGKSFLIRTNLHSNILTREPL